MFRKRKLATPHFRMPSPFNPITGMQANLRQEGLSPFCAMMQVAAEDTYENYVICRGFDTRILKFIDYAEGDDNKPGISVAKPFGNRRTGIYGIGEIYPVLLPTQGNADVTNFRQVTYIPPSPVGVNWRVGQNPGAVTGGGADGGQPEDLTDTIEILYDHNEKAVNWMLVDAARSGGFIEYTINSLSTAASGPYTGLVVASVTVRVGDAVIGSVVDVVDHSGSIFDEVSMTGYTGWAAWGSAWSLASGAACETPTPKHWYAYNRACEPDTGTYAEDCP